MSLRTRAVVLVAFTNTAAFAVLGALSYDETRAAAAQERESSVALATELTSLLAPLLDDALRSSDPASPGLDLERVLTWPHWSRMRDAVLVGPNPVELEVGGPVASAEFLVNPLGVEQRDPDFDLGLAKRVVEQAIRKGAAVEGGRGLAVPVMSDGIPRGGAYFVFGETRGTGRLPIGLWTLFLASTVGLTGIVSFYVTRSILRPIEGLAHVSRRIIAGDLTAIPDPRTSGDEIDDLTRSVTAMLESMRRHREELERECALAAERAKRAERDLLTAQRLASLGTLAAGIAHEINNPLGGMQNALRQLQHGDLPPQKRLEYFELIREGLDRVEAIVRRALTLVPRARSIGAFRVSEALADARALVEHRATRAGVGMTDALVPEHDWTRGAKAEAVQIFLNLYINALDALEERAREPIAHGAPWIPTVATQISVEPPWIRTEISDNGPGARPEDLDRIFDPFFTTKDPGKGSGLGLAVTYGLVRSFGGRIEAANRAGGGFVVRIDFPQADAGDSVVGKSGVPGAPHVR